MKVPANPRFEQDTDGNWWYRFGDGHRGFCKVRKCVWCGDEFVTYPARPLATHCSRLCGARCKFNHHDTAAELLAQPHSAVPKGREHSPHWKGGRRKARGGYIEVFMPEHHSIARTGPGSGRKYVREHRLVMEQMLGRRLLPKEQVHHINGIVDDNRPENLELWASQQPSGQRVGEGKHCPTCTCEAPKFIPA